MVMKLNQTLIIIQEFGQIDTGLVAVLLDHVTSGR